MRLVEYYMVILFFPKALIAMNQLHRVAPADRKQYFLLSHLEPEPGDRTTQGVKTAVRVVIVEGSFLPSFLFLLSPSISMYVCVCVIHLLFLISFYLIPSALLSFLLPSILPLPRSLLISPLLSFSFLSPSLRSQWRRKNIASSLTLS